MADESRLDHESPAVQKHLEINQNVIMRMAENSRSCKVWCVTLVAAVLVLVAQTEKANYALIALAPTVLFYVLDSYYLALERGFRKSFDNFVYRLHAGRVSSRDLFTVDFIGSIERGTLWAMVRSFSVWPFYLLLVVTIVLVWLLIIPPDTPLATGNASPG